MSEDLPPESAMEAHPVLWRVTDDVAHLREAHRRLDVLRDAAPEECRDQQARLRRRLYRDVAEAWALHGG